MFKQDAKFCSSQHLGGDELVGARRWRSDGSLLPVPILGSLAWKALAKLKAIDGKILRIRAAERNGKTGTGRPGQ